jgi:hypothetical protein
MTAADNPWFARNLANRMWAHFLGRGLVEPVDDVRATNPPSNPELLDALAKHLVEHKYDVKALIRAITASRVYQLSSQPNDTNEKDELNYSRAPLKRLPAEVLLDLVSQTTGVPEVQRRAGGFAGDPLRDCGAARFPSCSVGRRCRLRMRRPRPGVAQVLPSLAGDPRRWHDSGTVARPGG